MAYGSYLQRRDGRYYIQFRWRRGMAALAERQLYRAALGTTDYRQARLRLGECMGWVLRMNDAIDFVSLFQKNVVQLQGYLKDAWPISDERLHARRNYEELLKNLNRRAQAAGCDPTMIEPEFLDLLKRFVRQNTDAEAWVRKAERAHAYEQGRADMRGLLQESATPVSFSQPQTASPSSINGTANGAALTKVLPSAATTTALSPLGDRTMAPMAASFPFDDAGSLLTRRFSDALAEFLKEDEAAGNNADDRSLAELLVRFIIEALDDPVVSTFDLAQAKALDTMLPDIPKRLALA